MSDAAAAVPLLPAAGPVVGRLQGRQLARQELARSIYRPSFWSRLWQDFLHLPGLLLGHDAIRIPSWPVQAIVAICILAVLGAVVYYAGPARVNRHARGPVAEGRAMSAAAHRSAADGLAAAGDYPAAIIERVRAIAVDLESRQILPARPGRTAAELGAEAGLAIPAEAAALASGARLFDDVRYGGRPGSQYGYQLVRDLDDRIRAIAIQVSAHGPVQ